MPSSRMTNSKRRSTGPHTNATQHRRSQTSQLSVCRCAVIVARRCLQLFDAFWRHAFVFIVPFISFASVSLLCVCCLYWIPLFASSKEVGSVGPFGWHFAPSHFRLSVAFTLAAFTPLPAVPSCCSSLRASLIRSRCSCCCVGTRPARRGEAQRAEGSFGAESHRRFVQLLCYHDAH